MTTVVVTHLAAIPVNHNHSTQVTSSWFSFTAVSSATMHTLTGTINTASLSDVTVLVNIKTCSICRKERELSPHSLTHSHTHTLTHSHAHALTHSLTHTHTLTHSLTHLRTHSLTHTLPHSLTHSLTHTLTHSLAHSLPHSLTQYRLGSLTYITNSFSSWSNGLP